MTVYVRDPAGRARLALSDGPQKHADGARTIIEARILFKAVRKRWDTEGNPRKGEPRVYAWVHDFGDDWCVFRVESTRDRKLMLVPYSITDGSVIFGEPVEVTHTSLYEPIESSLKSWAVGARDRAAAVSLGREPLHRFALEPTR